MIGHTYALRFTLWSLALLNLGGCWGSFHWSSAWIQRWNQIPNHCIYIHVLNWFSDHLCCRPADIAYNLEFCPEFRDWLNYAVLSISMYWSGLFNVWLCSATLDFDQTWCNYSFHQSLAEVQSWNFILHINGCTCIRPELLFPDEHRQGIEYVAHLTEFVLGLFKIFCFWKS